MQFIAGAKSILSGAGWLVGAKDLRWHSDSLDLRRGRRANATIAAPP